jgi:hypothetical protein
MRIHIFFFGAINVCNWIEFAGLNLLDPTGSMDFLKFISSKYMYTCLSPEMDVKKKAAATESIE